VDVPTKKNTKEREEWGEVAFKLDWPKKVFKPPQPREKHNSMGRRKKKGELRLATFIKIKENYGKKKTKTGKKETAFGAREKKRRSAGR